MSKNKMAFTCFLLSIIFLDCVALTQLFTTGEVYVALFFSFLIGFAQTMLWGLYFTVKYASGGEKHGK